MSGSAVACINDQHTHLSSRPRVAQTIRINKFFTEHGICSRREADRLIESGVITINGRVAKLGDQVTSDDVIAREGRVISWGKANLYIKYHKPVGITTTSESHVPRNIIAKSGIPERFQSAVGQGFIRPHPADERRRHRQRDPPFRIRTRTEYLVQVHRPFNQYFLDHISQGVVILGRKTKPCRTLRAGRDQFSLYSNGGTEPANQAYVPGAWLSSNQVAPDENMHITAEGLCVGESERAHESGARTAHASRGAGSRRMDFMLAVVNGVSQAVPAGQS